MNRHSSTDASPSMPAGLAVSAHSRVEGAAVEQEVLANDEARRGSAQKGARITKFRGIAHPAGRVGLTTLGEHLLKRDVLAPGLVLDARTQPVGQKRAGQQTVDRHIVFGDLPRNAGAEGGETGASPIA